MRLPPVHSEDHHVDELVKLINHGLAYVGSIFLTLLCAGVTLSWYLALHGR